MYTEKYHLMINADYYGWHLYLWIKKFLNQIIPKITYEICGGWFVDGFRCGLVSLTEVNEESLLSSLSFYIIENKN